MNKFKIGDKVLLNGIERIVEFVHEPQWMDTDPQAENEVDRGEMLDYGYDLEGLNEGITYEEDELTHI